MVVNALVDTGSSFSFISFNWVQQHNIVVSSQAQSPPKFQGVNGSQFGALGFVTLCAHILGADHQIKFCVIHSPIPILLGTNVLTRVGMSITLSNGQVQMKRVERPPVSMQEPTVMSESCST
jgi:hypothetical protein